MRVIGFDPGLALLGYGVLDVRGAQEQVLVDCGVVQTGSTLSLPRRLGQVYSAVTELVQAFRPDAVAVEELFFNKNVKTALTVGHARGALLSAVIQYTDEIYEYTPLQVKQAVTGYGRADKQQIQQMVKALLRLQDVPRPDDAADAVAVALCHANTVMLRAALKST
ncbi:MAG: crossover junction endodeoxyribonuclease RuvC [Bacillota bacterium]